MELKECKIMKKYLAIFGVIIIPLTSYITYFNLYDNNKSSIASSSNDVVSYDEFIKITDRYKEDFKFQDFKDINKRVNNINTKVTSYPSEEWGSRRNTTYKGDALKPIQIDFFYTMDEKNLITKVTFVYAPTSIGREYLLVDYHDKLDQHFVEEEYASLGVTPYYMVGFTGKGYHVFVSTTFKEEYYKSNVISSNEKDQLVSYNAEMVRGIQEFLIEEDID